MNRSISGDRIAQLPSGKAPERRLLEGRLVTVEPIDLERHAQALYLASHETAEARRIWDYLPDGPFDDPSRFKTWLSAMAGHPDRAVFAFRDRQSDRFAGMATY